MADATIGNVGVEVTPNAQGFWETFKRDTLADARTTGDELGRKLGAGLGDTAGAEARARIDTALRGVTATVDVKADTTNAKKQISLLGLAIAGAGPAAIPIAGVAVGAFGAAVLGLGALALAFKGVTTEMKAGTELGDQYGVGVNKLQGYLSQLEHTAASAALPAFNNAVKQASDLFPNLNAEVGQFAGIAGDIADHVLHGLIGGFVTLEPLFTDLALGADHLAVTFDKYANGGGLQKFQVWVEQNLPAVERDLGAVAESVAKLIAAIAPLGVTSLGAFGLVARAINALPVEALRVLVPLLVDGYVAFQAYKGLDNIAPKVASFATAIAGFVSQSAAVPAAAAAVAAGEAEIAVAADAAAIAERGAGLALTTALGPIGAVVVGVALLASTFLGSHGPSQQAVQDIQDYTAALKADNGVIADHVKQTLAQKIADSGAVELAGKLGIGVSQVTQGIVAGGPALAQLKTNLQQIVDAGLKYTTNGQLNRGVTSDQTKALAQQAITAQNLLGIINQQTGEIDTTVAKDKLLQSVQGSLGVSTTDLANKGQKLADAQAEVVVSLGIQTTTAQNYARVAGYVSQSYLTTENNAANYRIALLNVKTAQDNAGTSAQLLLAAMDAYSQSAGTAADKSQLLGAVLKTSQGDALSYGAAISGAYDATRNLIKNFDATQKSAINAKTGLIDYTKEGAGPLVGELQAMQDAAVSAAQAVYLHEVSTKGDNVALKDATTLFETMTGGALVNNAKQLGITKDEAGKLADQYFKVPKDLTTTVASIGLTDLNDTLNKIGLQLSYLTNHPWNMTLGLDVNAKGIPLSAADATATANAAAALAGSVLSVAGAGKPATRYAFGGSVPGAGTSDSVAAMLTPGEYVSTTASTGRNAAALAAGNRGATLVAHYATGGLVGAAIAGGAPSPSAPQVVQIVLDRRVLATAVIEQQQQDARR